MEIVVRLHKEREQYAVSTNAITPESFLAAASSQVSEVLTLNSDSAKHLAAWLPQLVEIACKLKGYKADVTESRVTVAGRMMPSDVVAIHGHNVEKAS